LDAKKRTIEIKRKSKNEDDNNDDEEEWKNEEFYHPPGECQFRETLRLLVTAHKERRCEI
jgi:hypothetical protein